MIAKQNWKYKRTVNLSFSKLRSVPYLLRGLIWLIWLFRALLRGFRHAPADPIGGVIVNDELRLIYVGNPKVGSSTLKTIFMNSMKNSTFFLDTSYAQFAREHPEKRCYQKFTFIRDPVERAYSCWQDKISNKKRFADIFIITRFKGLYPDMSFDSFAKWLCTPSGQDEFADRHWMSQIKLVSSGDDSFDDLTIRMLDDLSATVIQYTGSIGTLNNENLSINSLGQTLDIKKNLSEETINLIRRRYQKDYIAFQPLLLEEEKA